MTWTPPTQEEIARTNRRAKDLRDIEQLYGTDTPEGREMLQEIMAKYALALLPDEAIRDLANMHRERDARG